MRPAVPLAFAAFLVLRQVPIPIADPPGDTVDCRTGAATSDRSADIVSTVGLAIEDGTGISFEITFARPLHVPDPSGSALRVDVLLRDPSLPATSFGIYRDVNRIVRFQAVPDASIQIMLLAERGRTSFPGASVDGRVLKLEFPGRLVTRDQDLAGPDLEDLRWSVVAVDDGVCDFLGEGVPSNRLAGASPQPLPPVLSLTSATGGSSGDAAGKPPTWVPVAVIGGLLGGLLLWALAIRRRAVSRRR